jgi:uncharacterized Zn finger protein
MRRGRWYREPWYARRFERTRPIPVAGGIKAHVRGAAAFKTWWARRWIEALESFGQGARLSCGRAYARNGQVASLSITGGQITAVVQGSRPKPYDVSIRLGVLPAAKWRAALRKVPARLLEAAKPLAGDVGAELEEAFRAARVSLLPEHSRDLVATCTCPDWGDPCKHVAAVHYIFGAELERDPLLLFKLRGIEAKELLEALMGSARGSAAKRRTAVAKHDPGETPSPGTQPLAADPATYFHASPLPALDLMSLAVPAVPAAFLKPLGSLPFWRGSVPLIDVLTPIYRAASIAGCALVMGEVFDEVVAGRRRGLGE